MVWIMYAMFAVIILTIILAIVVFVNVGKRKNTTAGTFDVFEISGNQLTILAGIPVTYEINEIESITFTASRAPRSTSAYNGIIRVIKTDGKKSRPFLFDSSAYKKKMVLINSKQEIEQTIQYLMDDLKQHHIRCSRTM